ncbi:MAG: asparagine synthase-related protein, partial [Cyclobacteriaceae bacterium]
KYARKAVDMFGGLHHIYELTEDCINQFDDFIDSIDQPIADGGAFCTYLLCQHASKDVKVILSGAGADELFAGYNRHQAFHFYLKNLSWMRRILPLLKTVGKALPTGISHPWRKQCRLVAKFTNDLHKDPETTYDHFRSLGTKNLYRDQGSFGVQKNSSAASYDEWFQHALLTDRQSYLVSDLLAMSDVMSMRWGLEMRMPYLDENIYEAIRSENAGYLIQKGKKWILKELLTTYGGKIFAQRSKSGFGLPLGEWLRNGPWRDLLSIIEKPDARIYQYLDFASTQLIIRQHIKRQADKSQEIWALIVLEKWLLKKGF